MDEKRRRWYRFGQVGRDARVGSGLGFGCGLGVWVPGREWLLRL